MNNLYYLYKALLTESAIETDIASAIDNKMVVEINYSGSNVHPAGKRIIQIYALGTSFKGNAIIRAYQISGVTKTANKKWKIFLVKNIQSVRFIRSFSTPKYWFNPKGDKSMQSVRKIINFTKPAPVKNNIPKILPTNGKQNQINPPDKEDAAPTSSTS